MIELTQHEKNQLKGILNNVKGKYQNKLWLLKTNKQGYYKQANEYKEMILKLMNFDVNKTTSTDKVFLIKMIDSNIKRLKFQIQHNKIDHYDKKQTSLDLELKSSRSLKAKLSKKLYNGPNYITTPPNINKLIKCRK